MEKQLPQHTIQHPAQQTKRGNSGCKVLAVLDSASNGVAQHRCPS
jgi:hypothetical protein